MDFESIQQSTIFGESEPAAFQPYKGYRFNLPIGMSYCCACKKLKRFDEFNKTSHNVHGIKGKCRDCEHAYYAENLRAWNSSHMRERNLRVKFDLSVDEYQAIYDFQNGVCAICGNPETKIIQGTIAQLSVDHDHSTGLIRGLLCSGCNLGLGYFRDNPENLEAAIEYLARSKA